MRRTGRQAIIFIVIFSVLCIPFWSEALAQRETTISGGEEELQMIMDALVIRPVGIVGILFGTAVFVVSIPFSALGGNTRTVYENLVASPARYTFKRELGDF
jgi:hypothetical protein